MPDQESNMTASLEVTAHTLGQLEDFCKAARLLDAPSDAVLFHESASPALLKIQWSQ
jgi:hypothetical protein